jgi:glycosyltransferase involved in cell wall biosynthesis
MPASAPKKRVLFISLEGQVGGAETSLLLLAKHLRVPFDVAVACPCRGTLAAQFQCLQVPVFSLPEVNAKRGVLRLLGLIAAAFPIARVICRCKPDIIHCNNLHAAVASLLPSMVLGRKVIWHARDMTKSRLAVRICGLLSSGIITVSASVESFLKGLGVSHNRMSVIHNGVEVRSARPPGHSGRFVFANIGQFVPWKNQRLFIEAAERFAAMGGNAEFLIIGSDRFGRDPGYQAELMRRVAASPIKNRIAVLGWQDDMEAVWPRVDCLVHVAQMEPFGRVIIEAMASGVPVIAVDSGGPGEIIENGKTGILVDSHNAHLLSDAMMKLANDREYAGQLAVHARYAVAARFSAYQTAGRTQQIYQQLLTV